MIQYHCMATELLYYIIVCRKQLIRIEYHADKYVKEAWGSASLLYDFCHIENSENVV